MKTIGRDRLGEALRSWGERPPRTSADEAARQVLARLPERGVGGWHLASPWRLATAAAGLALMLAVCWVTVPQRTVSPPGSREIALPPLADDVVLLWLDDTTPLYLTVAPPAPKGDS